ncbi:hypothetical protein PanWU01x14_175650 [Parasponia andersonii]|uniref:Uncharacterized protein n=1 Tax=Parasponia andersonii TaxID=3476 RepID=A0A2P5C822_PARAD|nr:hypothetical protein PanWU01x14_175650 [Parasponia andersonii]
MGLGEALGMPKCKSHEITGYDQAELQPASRKCVYRASDLKNSVEILQSAEETMKPRKKT